MRKNPPWADQTGRPRSRIHTLVGKTSIVSSVFIGTNVIGNYALKRGLGEVGVVESWSPENGQEPLLIPLIPCWFPW